jgi:hypothetical protein
VRTLSSQLSLGEGRADGCLADPQAAAWRVDAKAGRFVDRLAVIAPSGRILLQGELVDPVLARPALRG